jgi:GNAT superfamily N-acetyltransferase
VDRLTTTIVPLEADSPELKTAARWRHEAFLKQDGFSLADSEAQLTKLAAAPQGPETALVALTGDRPAGVCLLVLHELDPAHDYSPWLASLYVDPGFRGQGVARGLVRAIEEHARRHGVERLHLYTVDAEEFYRKCGWAVVERFVSNGAALVLMARDL